MHLINLNYVALLKYKPAIAGVLLIMTLGSCSMMQEIQVGDVQEIKINQIRKGGLDLELYIPIENPGKQNLKLTKMDLDLNLNGIELGNISNNEKVLIKKMSDEIYMFPVEVELKGFIKTTMALISLAEKNTAEYRLTGNLRVKYLCIKRNIQIDESGIVDLR